MPRLQPLAVPIQPPVTGPAWAVKPLGRNMARQEWPRRLVFWDVEGDQQPDGSFTFRCAHARLYLRQPDYTYQPEAEVLARSAEGLWATVHSWSRDKESMRLYASNMEIDLGIADYSRHLWQRLGYRARPGRDLVYAESSRSPFLYLRRGQRARLAFVDTETIFHCGTAQLGRDLGMDEQPGLDDPEARCAWDTAALAGAVLEYLERFRQLGVSPKAPTGTGNGFAILRTLHLQEGTVIHHTDPDLYLAEVESKYAGRREAWRHGTVHGPLEEWDYTHAHAMHCLQPLPCKVRDPTWAQVDIRDAPVATLQEWLVTTDVPCVPYHQPSGGVIYPVGRFPAVLWGAEAALAMDNGATLQPLGRAWQYELAPVLRPWAEWILEQLELERSPIWQRCLKSWSHQMVGKWAQANAIYEQLKPTPQWPEEWRTGPFAVANCGGHDGYQRMLYTDFGVWGIKDEAVPADHANVAIYSYVTALTRCQLWRAMLAAGLDEVVAVNGDGLLVTKRGGDRLRRATREGGKLAGMGLRRKQLYRKGVDVWNAQAVIDRDPASAVHKVAGLPRRAERTGPTTWLTEIWHQSLLDGPVSRPGVWRLPPGPLGRVRAADGRTTAYKVAR